jgi:hypothetical protein
MNADAERDVRLCLFTPQPAGLHRESGITAPVAMPGWWSTRYAHARDQSVARCAAGRWRASGEGSDGPPAPVRRRDRSLATSAVFVRRQDLSGFTAIRWPRRCLPTACGWSGVRSSITGRAAFCPRAVRSRTRWSSCAVVRDGSRIRARPLIELYEGLEAASQNRWPSLRFDLLSMTAPLSPFIGAGFYYKTFMWPARFWEKVYEPMIRRAAGLGRAAGQPDPDHYEKAFLHCDVLVIGAGPCGPRGCAGCGTFRGSRRAVRRELRIGRQASVRAGNDRRRSRIRMACVGGLRTCVLARGAGHASDHGVRRL